MKLNYNNILKVFKLLLTIFMFSMLYLFYIFVINTFHSSFSIVSVPFVTVPYIIVILFCIKRWKEIGLTTFTKSSIIILLVFSTIAFSVAFYKLFVNELNSKFSIERWINNPVDRVYMVDDLLSKYHLSEMSKEEITVLLGEPTSTEYFSPDNKLVYVLGPERGFMSIDYEWLLIILDEKEKVKEIKIETD